MKLLFASDIHGSYPDCSKVIKILNNEGFDRLFLLGDILYHGPRNDLPSGYSPKNVIALLNENKDKIFCVRGNCDTEVDQMVLEFPILADYAMLYLNDRTVFMTHGHNYNNEKPPLIKKGDILLHGHTHVQTVDTTRDYVYINPGSVSIPKENNPKSYMTYENGVFEIKNLYDGTVVNSYNIM